MRVTATRRRSFGSATVAFFVPALRADTMTGDGPFLWLAPQGSPFGYHRLPKGGMCLSSFVFVQDARGRLLLGKYADDSRWDALAGLDASRRKAHGAGWTIPASHLKFGEDPREAGARIARDILGFDALELSEPRVETDVGTPKRFPELGDHYDVWFFQDARHEDEVPAPPWYAQLAFHDPLALAPHEYARGHDEIVARWLSPRRRAPREGQAPPR